MNEQTTHQTTPGNDSSYSSYCLYSSHTHGFCNCLETNL
jgi:hypothetical protein